MLFGNNSQTFILYNVGYDRRGLDMQHFKKIGSKIIWPGLAAMVLLAAVSAALLCYTVLCGEKDTIISYLAYIVSTYTLIMVV